jgi:BAHD acyltransferase
MITVLRKLCVYPAQPSDQKYCDLITFDLPYVNLQYNQKILLYPSPNQGFVSVVESLEKSLSEALVHFYPLAGRLCLDEDGILKVDCNDAGVDFIEASSHDGLSDLTDCDSSSHVMHDLVPFIP